MTKDVVQDQGCSTGPGLGVTGVLGGCGVVVTGL